MTQLIAPQDRPGVRLRRLFIENFRGIDRLDLDFSDGSGGALDLAVLAGDNGCGKTAILEAVLILLGKKFGPSLDVQVRFGADDFTIRGEFKGHGPDPIVSSATSAGTRRLDPALTDLSIEYFSARRVNIPLNLAPEMSTLLAAQKGTAETEVLRLLLLKERLIKSYYRQLRMPGKLDDPQGPFARLQHMWAEMSGSGDQLDVIPQSNNPGSGEDVVLRAAQPLPPDVTSLAQARKLAVNRPDIPRMVPLDHLSAGQMELFSYAGPMVFRDSPLDLVLLDEPEQHMHVKWHRQILRALRSLAPSAQFLVATHSEEILDSALSYEQFVLVRNDDLRAQLDEPLATEGE